MKLLSALALMLALMMAASAGAVPVFSAHVSKVADGDSLEVEYAGQKIKLRLWGIDAPEIRQSYGKQAKALLAVMVNGRRIEVQGKDIDIYNRLVALVWVDGQLVNEEMVRQGAAWVYQYYCREQICDSWQRLEDDARLARRGLWANDKAIPPWHWRRMTRH
ncbi:MAG: thermonuclease family protein [Desulfobulbaceae bacterium]|jgi:endonuclease YncB( thermonuclease family)|nr:thermonuclease family protein [Desulfobulbaceae bacterium]